MKLSKLNEIPSTREMISAFRGYNHNTRISEGEFYDMKNLTSDEYPNLSPRKKRGIYATEDICADDTCNCEFQGMISKDSLWYVFGGKLYENHKMIENFELDPTGKKSLVSMGAYIIIMPDKKYINTQDYSDKGDIQIAEEDAFSADINSGDGLHCYFIMCDKDGKTYENPIYEEINGEQFPIDIVSSRTTPYTSIEDLPSGMLWVDTSSEPSVLKIYDAKRSAWTEIQTVYTQIYLNGIGEKFDAGDGVFISGSGIDAVPKLKQVFEKSVIIEKKLSDNAIVVKGSPLFNIYSLIDYNDSSSMTVKVSRPMPDLDFVIESGNRLWGCKYGLVGDKMVNEIYASKLGDFKNWNSFAGISTDSYRVSVGTDGAFTGAINYLGYPLFFKEDCIHKVYGNYPANYQIQTTACRGVQQGSAKSLAIVNETLFYKSRYSVCAYDGALPVEMSGALGNVQYSDAVAGSLGNKYYISMKDAEDYRHLFVYDTFKGLWHKEDDVEASQFCQHKGNLYYIDRDVRQIRCVQAISYDDGNVEPNPIEWSAETGIIGVDTPGKKYVSRLVVRMQLNTGASVKVFANYDSSNIWEQLFIMTNSNNLRTYSAPIRTTRCDHFRLRFEGSGECQIFSISKNIEEGSDL